MNACWELENKVLMDDIIYISQDTAIPWEQLKGKQILVTGATGLIGSLLIKSLLYISDLKNINLTIFACCRNKEKAERIFTAEHCFLGKVLHFIESDIRSPLPECLHIDYIIHTASPTASADFVERPVDTILITLQGTTNILELAKKSSSKKLVYLSSMEVYGILEKDKISEDDSGYLNPLIIRNSYPQAKRLAEALCMAYSSQYGVPISIIRLTQTFGPGADPLDNRVFMQFAKAVKEGKDIILQTEGKTKRDYLYTADAARGIFSAMLLGGKSDAYNLSNPDTYISIYEMAKLCTTLNDKINIHFNKSEKAPQKFLPEIHISLNTNKIDLLNKFPKKNLKEMFINLINYLNSIEK